MEVKCKACVKDKAKQENLCRCIRILGGDPITIDETVSVEYKGEKIGTMIKLFESFSPHTIDIHPS